MAGEVRVVALTAAAPAAAHAGLLPTPIVSLMPGAPAREGDAVAAAGVARAVSAEAAAAAAGTRLRECLVAVARALVPLARRLHAVGAAEDAASWGGGAAPLADALAALEVTASRSSDGGSDEDAVRVVGSARALDAATEAALTRLRAPQRCTRQRTWLSSRGICSSALVLVVSTTTHSASAACRTSRSSSRRSSSNDPKEAAASTQREQARNNHSFKRAAPPMLRGPPQGAGVRSRSRQAVQQPPRR